MKSFLTALLPLITFYGYSQSTYEPGMKRALDLWGENKLDEAANLM